MSSSSHTASSIVAQQTVPVSHDLAIRGYSAIKNSCTTGSYIKSAEFVAGGHRWYVRYYPKGCSSRDADCVAFLLYHDRDAGAGAGADQEDKVAVGPIKFSLLGPDDGDPAQTERGWYRSYHKMTYDEPSAQTNYYAHGLISRAALEQSYLRDDAFSVRCEFHVCIIVTETTEDEEPASTPARTHVPADVHEALLRFVSRELTTDVAFHVGDETFPAHRRFLATQSAVLAALLDGPMRENTAPSVRIDGINPRVFKAMLDFIYTGNLLVVPPSTIVDDNDDDDDPIAMTQQLVVAADRYNLQRLKSICADKLRTHINTATVATTLDLAHRHGCQELKDACFDFLAPPRGNLRAILKGGGFEQLIIDYPSVFVELLARVAPSPPC